MCIFAIAITNNDLTMYRESLKPMYKDYSIQDGVGIIPKAFERQVLVEEGFADCLELTSIVIPDNIVEIKARGSAPVYCGTRTSEESEKVNQTLIKSKRSYLW